MVTVLLTKTMMFDTMSCLTYIAYLVYPFSLSDDSILHKRNIITIDTKLWRYHNSIFIIIKKVMFS